MDERHCTRRRFLAIAASALAFGVVGAPIRARAFGEQSGLGVGHLEYPGGRWNARPNALRRLLLEVELSTSVLVDLEDHVVQPRIDDGPGSLLGVPIVFVSGDRAFPAWTDAARAALSRYLAAGGTLVIDSSEARADGEFRAAIERELAAIVPDQQLERVERDHVVHKSFYLCSGGEGRTTTADGLDGIELDGRLAVIYSHNDLMGAWARDDFGNYEYPLHEGGEDRRARTYRLGVNILLYALCLDYKQDQVHVPFILRRRRWRVD